MAERSGNQKGRQEGEEEGGTWVDRAGLLDGMRILVVKRRSERASEGLGHAWWMDLYLKF